MPAAVGRQRSVVNLLRLQEFISDADFSRAPRHCRVRLKSDGSRIAGYPMGAGSKLDRIFGWKL